MYEYKIFQAESSSLEAVNRLLEKLTNDGWEPDTVSTNSAPYYVLARRLKTILG